jgi:hypothetical protein
MYSLIRFFSTATVMPKIAMMFGDLNQRKMPFHWGGDCRLRRSSSGWINFRQKVSSSRSRGGVSHPGFPLPYIYYQE